MTQFYIAADDAIGLRKCEESVASRQPTTVSGIGQDGRIHGYTGVVQSVEKTNGPKGNRVTMLDAMVTN